MSDDAKDAERYRWLRDNWVRSVRSADGPEYMALDYVWNVRVPNKYPSLDAAIDAAMEAA